VFGGHSMSRDSIARTLAALNTLWDGGTFLVDRSQAPSFAVRGARMTMALQVQPHVLTDFLERDRGLSRGSGFLARFLIAQPVSTQGRRPYRETDVTPELDAFSTASPSCWPSCRRSIPSAASHPQVLDFSPEAKAHWIERYNAIESQLDE
jgi:putative DNA primase/helicase